MGRILFVILSLSFSLFVGCTTAQATVRLGGGRFAGANIGGVVPAVADPCAGKAVGDAAAGSVAICAGTWNGSKYMTTPGHCEDSTNPTCNGGTDSLMKAWDATMAFADTGATDPVQGAANTNILAAPAEGGNYNAAQYCQDMDYGGYLDWYLPAKDELNNVLWLNSTNCQPGPSGACSVTPLLTGFGAANYWSSTESSNMQTWFQSFDHGTPSPDWKMFSFLVRCVRRY